MNTRQLLLQDAEQDEPLVVSSFVGRRAELDQLRLAFFSKNAASVALHGVQGIGKTSLALMFGHLHREFFSSGIYHVHANPGEPLHQTVDAMSVRPTGPQLLILDDLDLRPSYSLYSEIEYVRNAYPLARLLCLSCAAANVPAELTFVLAGWNNSDIHQFFSKWVDIVDPGITINSLVQAASGNALMANFMVDLLRSGTVTPRALLQQLDGFSQSGILDAYGNPISTGSAIRREIIADVVSVSDRLLEHVHANPNAVYELSSRRFEEFVAELLNRLGYEITLTSASRDGGKDIYAAKKDHLGSFLYVVECKKYSPENRVGVGLIRQLNGVVQAERATAGILATTSFFTKPAEEFQRLIPHQISLKNFFGIQEWLKEVFRRRA